MKPRSAKVMYALLAIFACLVSSHGGPVSILEPDSESVTQRDMDSESVNMHDSSIREGDALDFSTFLPPPGKTVLDARGEGVNKRDIYYNYGTPYTDTRVFYQFPNHNAVLLVKIGNSKLEFPVSARLHVFAKDTKGEEIKQWISNQHSDFIKSAPKPETTYVLPATSLSEKHEFVEVVKFQYTELRHYFRYKVTFQIKDVPVLDGLTLKDFSDETYVFVDSHGPRKSEGIHLDWPRGFN